MTDANETIDFKSIQIAPLDDHVAFSMFRCGEREIDDWVAQKAVDLCGINRIKLFCARQAGDISISGFYCLSFESKDTKRLVPEHSKFANLPVVYITYLAVIRSLQRKGLGTFLLMNAL